MEGWICERLLGNTSQNVVYEDFRFFSVYVKVSNLDVTFFM